MAIIRPENPIFNHSSEQQVFNFIREKLPKNYIGYFSYYLDNLREFDFLLLVPDKGCVFIELKGIYHDQILEVPDNSGIYYSRIDGEEIFITSPFKQANQARFSLIKRIKNELNTPVTVIPMVGYPYIPVEGFYSKELDRISDWNLTLLKEDFENPEKFMEKIDEAFIEYGRQDPPMTLETKVSIRKFFESENQIAESEVSKDFISKLGKERKNYSLLHVLGKDSQENNIEKILEEWETGTKIFLITDNQEKLDKTKQRLKEKLKNKNLLNQLYNPDKGLIFNFFGCKFDGEIHESIRLLNGEEWEEHKDLLEKIDRNSEFNLGQYKIEHAPINSDIAVTAGAGTGKTFSMISRVNYLIFKHNYSPEEIQEKVTLITFTNKAAENMQKTLRKNFQNYFLLTGNKKFFKYIEALEGINISTIHSFIKRFIEINAASFGLGKEFSLVSGKEETKRLMEKVVDDFLVEKGVSIEENKINLYHFQKSLRIMLEKIKNRSIDVLDPKVTFGVPKKTKDKDIHELIVGVLKETEKKKREELKEKNSMQLSDLVPQLLKASKKGILTKESLIGDYVFVDEFQDTDDIQIDLIKNLRDIFGFSLFVVGDVKQCIYRFRGAEEKAFDRLGVGNKEWKNYSIYKNYRTDRSLLGEFEKVFEKWGDLGKLSYNPSQDKLVSYLEYDKSKKNKVKLKEEKEFEEKLIKTIIDMENRLEEGKLAILVRENKEVERIKEIASANRIYVETEVGGDLFRLEPVLDFYKLILALKYYNNPKYLYNLCQTSYIDEPLPKRFINNHRNDRKKLLEYFGEKKGPLNRWQEYLQNLKREPVLKVLKEIIYEVQPWEKYMGKNSREKDEERQKKFYKRNLEELFEKLTEFSNTDYLTINRIENYLRIMILTGQEETSREPQFEIKGENDILCMTVHKAKGLEFERVLLPFTFKNMDDNRKIGGTQISLQEGKKIGYSLSLRTLEEENKPFFIQNEYFEFKEEKGFRLNEEVRILYVAMTRAERELAYFFDEGSDFEYSWQNFIEGSL